MFTVFMKNLIKLRYESSGKILNGWKFWLNSIIKL